MFYCYTKFATTAQGPKMSQAKQLVEAKFSVRECFTSQLESKTTENL